MLKIVPDNHKCFKEKKKKSDLYYAATFDKIVPSPKTPAGLY